MDATNKWISYLHEQRKISLSVIQKPKVFESEGWLAIPIFDIDGRVLFHKYRRAPWMPDSLPKYRYEKGGSLALYGIDQIDYTKTHPLFLTEGEFDVFTLRSLGYTAISGTGGAGSFKEEWEAYVANQKLHLWYDNDDAGIAGAVKVALILKNFTYVWTPPAWGKDVNDLYVNKGANKVVAAIKNGIPISIPDLTTKKSIHSCRRTLAALRQSLPQHCVGVKFINLLIAKIGNLMPAKRKKPTPCTDEFEYAKSYPIENIIEVHHGFAKYCPFHNPEKRKEKSPSFKVYKNNTAYCFGACGKAYDSIDIYRAVNDIPDTKEGFKETLKKMNNV